MVSHLLASRNIYLADYKRLIYNKYSSLYSSIMNRFYNAHRYGIETDPTPYINELFPLIKSAVPSLVAICVLICIYMFIVIITGLISIAIPQKSVSVSKKRYSNHVMTISNQQVVDKQPASSQDECIFCTQCGKKFDINAKFCSSCGAKIDY